MMEEELAPEDDIVLNLQANQPWRGPPNASLLPLVSSEIMTKSIEETWMGSMTGKRGREEERIESSDVDLSKTARDVVTSAMTWARKTSGGAGGVGRAAGAAAAAAAAAGGGAKDIQASKRVSAVAL